MNVPWLPEASAWLSERAAARPPLVCVACGAPVPRLFVGGGGAGALRLARCRSGRCRAIADRYLEYEPVLLVVDLLLHRVPAYRHLAHNRYHPALIAVRRGGARR